jgi:chromosome segregation ATPase
VYQIQIDVGRTTMFGDLTVRQDPRIDVSRVDLAARQAALMSLYELQAPVYHAGQAVETLNLQLSDVEQFLRETAATESFVNELEGIKEELDDLERELRRLGPGGRSRQIEASTTRPTEDQLQHVERAWKDIPEVIGRLNALILVRIPTFYGRLNDERFPADPGDYLEVPRRRGG